MCGSGDPLAGGGDGTAVFGNDIFDAAMGTPGTYLSYDMYGNLSFGFSIPLWQLTMSVIDAGSSISFTSLEYDTTASLFAAAQHLGFQVVMIDNGVSTQVWGVVPDLIADEEGMTPAMENLILNADTAYDIAAANGNGISMGDACGKTADPGLCSMALGQADQIFAAMYAVYEVLYPGGIFNAPWTSKPFPPSPPALLMPTVPASAGPGTP